MTSAALSGSPTPTPGAATDCSDVVELALAQALTSAAAAGAWTTVEALAAELGARRKTRDARSKTGAVVDLGIVRRPLKAGP